MSAHFYLGFFGWLVVIAATVYLNYFRIEIRKKKPVYLNSNWSRAVFGLACLALMAPGFDPFIGWTGWVPAILPGIYVISSFGLLFDPGLNDARGKELDYQGKDSGWFDSMSKAVYYSIKGLCFVGMVVSVVMMFR